MNAHCLARFRRDHSTGLAALRATVSTSVARARRYAPLVYVGTALAAFSTSALAQDAELGGTLLEKTCAAITSPLMLFVFVIAILGCVVLLVLNEGKGLGSRVVQIALGAAIVLGIGTIVGILGLNGDGSCATGA
ncbi:MAG TPA: hypothetical protein VFQ88_09530 [Nevskiaceae bacterium]|nr:hypothetical protein [Nevskiaceae bacterium]